MEYGIWQKPEKATIKITDKRTGSGESTNEHEH